MHSRPDARLPPRDQRRMANPLDIRGTLGATLFAGGGGDGSGKGVVPTDDALTNKKFVALYFTGKATKPVASLRPVDVTPQP